MNENMNKEQDSQNGSEDVANGQKFCKMCGSGMCYHGHRHFWLRWLLGIVILAVVFCVGVKVGEFKGAFGRGFNNRAGYNTRLNSQPMMRGYPYGYPSGMMQGGNGTYQTQPSTNILKQPTSTTTPVK
jgi:hypothetical protein